MPKKSSKGTINDKQATVFGGIMLVVLIALAFIFSDQIRGVLDRVAAGVKNSANSSIKVASIETVESMRVINGEPDYGIEVTCVVSNESESSRDITITAMLSSSEGEWEREQTLRFNANESRNLSYFFHEPTVNATNLQSRVKIK
ncbi:MAG: hypothetical protein H6815_03865 [Phycisphaeraceae bacterium]|nr:hypothetical protein [Phycisphaerales bacterium]MCB9859566.1 hypothetical protein [Phycisphaeraceae bacterium]